MRGINEINKLMKKKMEEENIKPIKTKPDVKFIGTREFVACSKQEYYKPKKGIVVFQRMGRKKT